MNVVDWGVTFDPDYVPYRWLTLGSKHRTIPNLWVLKWVRPGETGGVFGYLNPVTGFFSLHLGVPANPAFPHFPYGMPVEPDR